ncbi:MAG: AAA family ATPase [Aquamicrobium sp.]|uniref:AAA family ATPase n=1 Tax=Aquamicrobium sp. TaxID=1872579 RepID=UPI00349E491F|nr:AAA family ATPase [Aquamicrobium sp.]
MTNENACLPGNPALGESGLAVVLSGCSGGGKSTLLDALAARGYTVWPEAGRQIVREEMHLGGDGLPWANAEKFVTLAASRTMYFFNAAETATRPVFFDRSLVDLTSFLDLKGIVVPAHLKRAVEAYRYRRDVFVVPPWPDIFAADAERRKSFEEAYREYEALVAGYRAAGYGLVEVPRLGVEARADFVLRHLGEAVPLRPE